PERLAGPEREARDGGPRGVADSTVGADDLEGAGHPVATAAEPAGRLALVASPAADHEVARQPVHFAHDREAAAEPTGSARVWDVRVAFDEDGELGLQGLDRQVRGIGRVVGDAVDPVLGRPGAAPARVHLVVDEELAAA